MPVNVKNEWPRRFLLCATQRSGSTIICEDFANQDGLGNPNEYFTPVIVKNETPNIDSIFAKGRDKTGAEAAKIMATQIAPLQKLMGVQPEESPLINDRLPTAIGRAQYVYITRRETDRQALSRLRARSSGVYHVQQGAGTIEVKSALKAKPHRQNLVMSDKIVADLDGEVAEIEHENRMWKLVFSKWGVTPYHVVYEEAASATSNYLKPLGALVELDFSDDLAPRSLRKISDDEDDEIIRAYREIRPTPDGSERKFPM